MSVPAEFDDKAQAWWESVVDRIAFDSATSFDIEHINDPALRDGFTS